MYQAKFFKPNNEKYEKVLNLGSFLPPIPGGNDRTMTNFDGWIDLKYKMYKVQ
jgi:hypothetical protein